MAANSQQFGTRLDTTSGPVNELNVSSIEQQLASLTSFIRQMAADEQVNAVGSFPRQPQKNYNPYLNTYNPPNLSYGNQQENQPNVQQYRQPYPPKQQQDQTSSSGKPLEDIVKSLATNTLQFQLQIKQLQQEARASIKSLEKHMGQMATSISMLEVQGSGKLPSQIMVNPRENASAILLMNGKEVEIPKATLTSLEQKNEKDVTEEKSVPNDNCIPKRKFSSLSEYKSIPPFPRALVEPKKDEHNHELYETFRKYEVNISLLDAIKQIPRYAKFLKELCTLKRKEKLKKCEKINVGKNVSAIIQRNLSTKCKDPGMFSIPCTISNTRFEKGMLDSGVSINVMPYFIYASLKLGPLNEIGVQLADKSNDYPKGIVEDVLVKINDLVFPADFYVLNMGYSDQTIPILLGRPFLRTSKTKIDFYSGMITMKFDDKISEFNIYDAMKHPDETNPVYSIKVIDNLEQEVLELDENNAVKVAIDKHIEDVNQVALKYCLVGNYCSIECFFKVTKVGCRNDGVTVRKCTFFIDGPGSTGKTYLYKALLTTVRCRQLIAMTIASSGVAASLLPARRAGHLRFKIPLRTSPDMRCSALVKKYY
ncbi:uncharacterized protein LOC111374279 [Olea europaea var. sylvestris]|uniref:uncharacterized protein LOC111374279 n=1 Tax=Olea europaea var. sylvestris TaxID=158386 RepID=UPI000C1CF135|nr:uncharacterized protein LOC111374279 [Olea europaea var. sylvestris]